MKAFLLSLICVCSLFAESYTVYSEQLPPFNYEQDGKVLGTSTAILKQLLAKNGDSINGAIQVGPWAKGYHTVLNTHNTILYSTAKTPEREALFKWVGPVDTLTIGLVAKKSKKVAIKSIECLHNYTIAAMYETTAENLLLNLGMKPEELDRFTNIYMQMRKLQEERVDALAYGIEAIHKLLLEMGLDPYEYETVYILKKAELYFAFNKETPDATIDKLNLLLKKLKAEK